MTKKTILALLVLEVFTSQQGLAMQQENVASSSTSEQAPKKDYTDAFIHEIRRQIHPESEPLNQADIVKMVFERWQKQRGVQPPTSGICILEANDPLRMRLDNFIEKARNRSGIQKEDTTLSADLKAQGCTRLGELVEDLRATQQR